VTASEPLTTDRLRLCPARPADVPLLLEHWGRPEVRRFLFDGTAPDAAGVEAAVTAARCGTGALWLLRERPGGAFAGTAGLRPLEDLGTEVHYSLEPDRWGRGLAAEAAAAVLEHAFTRLGLPCVLAEVDAGNTASAAVVARLGMTPFATVPGTLGPMTRYRRDAPGR
jgi:[ribosomal protein S5]-alanine N-acetyltransferase